MLISGEDGRESMRRIVRERKRRETDEKETHHIF